MKRYECPEGATIPLSGRAIGMPQYDEVVICAECARQLHVARTLPLPQEGEPKVNPNPKEV